MKAVLDASFTKAVPRIETKATTVGLVYCPICTHTVEATIASEPRRIPKVVPGQKCKRCSAAIDAGYVIRANSHN